MCSVGQQLRIGVMLAKNPKNSRYVEEYAKDLKTYLDNNPTGNEGVRIGDLNDTGEVAMQELKVAKYENGNVHFSFFLKQSGDFSVFCSLNEKQLAGSQMIQVRDNPENTQPIKQSDPEIDYLKQEVQERAREEAERKREFLEMKKRQQEEDIKRAEEDLKAKVMARAEQNAKNFYMEKKIKEMKEADDKKKRMDMRIGGGYDIDRAKLMKMKASEGKIAGPSVSTNTNSKEETLDNQIPPETPTKSEMKEAFYEKQVSQYEGVNPSEYQEEEESASEYQKQEIETSAIKRPGSSGFRIKDISMGRSSRPNSRLGESAKQGPDVILNNLIGESIVNKSIMDSQILFENNNKRVPLKANRTGDNFLPETGSEMMVSRESFYKNQQSIDERQYSIDMRDGVGSSQSNKRAFKVSGGINFQRGMSQERGVLVRVPNPNEDRTAPKRQKGGFSLNKKVDSNKLPVLPYNATSLKTPSYPTIGSNNQLRFKKKAFK